MASRTRIKDLKADLDSLSIEGLIKLAEARVPQSITMADAKILEENGISGGILLLDAMTDERLKEMKLSVGAQVMLITLKREALGNKKRTMPSPSRPRLPC